MTIRVLIADDHAIMRDGLKALLSASRDIAVIAETGNGRDAVRRAQELKPDVVIMDISMPDLNGIEAARVLRHKCPDTRIVMLSMHSSSEHVFRAFEAGATAYLLKESAGSEVEAAVRAAHAGRRYLSRALAALDLDARPAVARGSPLESLSPRERHVLQLVVEGHSSAEIAILVHLSPKTVETYRSRLMKKLGVKDIPALVKFAIEHGITPGTVK
jgi:DNA-binding NarL/FixJ family response regulator